MMKPVCGNVEKVESIIGRIDNASTHDTSAAVNLRFQSGAIAHMFSSAVHDAPRIGEIYGSSGRFKHTLGGSNFQKSILMLVKLKISSPPS